MKKPTDLAGEYDIIKNWGKLFIIQVGGMGIEIFTLKSQKRLYYCYFKQCIKSDHNTT